MASKSIPSKLYCFVYGDVFPWSEKEQHLPARCIDCEHRCQDVMKTRVHRNIMSKQLWFDFGGDK